MLQQFVYISLTSLGSIACFSVWWNQSKFMQQSKVVVRLHSQYTNSKLLRKNHQNQLQCLRLYPPLLFG